MRDRIKILTSWLWQNLLAPVGRVSVVSVVVFWLIILVVSLVLVIMVMEEDNNTVLINHVKEQSIKVEKV